MRHIVIAGAALLVLTAGCVSPGGQQTATPAPTPDLEPGVECPAGLTVGFYGAGGESFWEPDVIRLGHSIPANTSFLSVAYVDGSVAGAKYNPSHDEAVADDGSPVRLNDSYSGRHTVLVVVYSDENENEQFDAGTDRPCLADGEVVQAGPRVVDFDRFADAGP